MRICLGGVNRDTCRRTRKVRINEQPYALAWRYGSFPNASAERKNAAMKCSAMVRKVILLLKADLLDESKGWKTTFFFYKMSFCI